jgi:hypothetical protein
MPFVGFEPMIPASERAKTVHALDRSATVTGRPLLVPQLKRSNYNTLTESHTLNFTHE